MFLLYCCKLDPSYKAFNIFIFLSVFDRMKVSYLSNSKIKQIIPEKTETGK